MGESILNNNRKKNLLLASWKKGLYSSVLLGTLFVGFQYMSSVNVHADGMTYVTFHDVDTNRDVDTLDGILTGQANDISKEFYKLKDYGEDTTGLPTTVTPDDNADPIVINVHSLNPKLPQNPPQASITPDGSDPYSNFNYRIYDQNGNFIENKHFFTDDDNYGNSSITQSLDSEGLKIKDSDDMDGLVENDYADQKICAVKVYAPERIVTVKYVDDNGKTLFQVNHALDRYGHTDVSDDLNDYYEFVDSPIIDNKNDSDVIHIKRTNTSVGNDEKVSSFKEGFAKTTTPNIYRVNNLHTNPFKKDLYHTNVTIEDLNGKVINSYVVSNNDHNLVDTGYFIDKYVNQPSDEQNRSILPEYLDLTKDSYVFKINKPDNYDYQNTNVDENDVYGDLNVAVPKANKVKSKHYDVNGKLLDKAVIQFHDIIKNEDINSIIFDKNCYSNAQFSMKDAISQLDGLGYDTSNINDVITPSSDLDMINVTPKGGNPLYFPAELTGVRKLQFQIFDQDDNFIENKYASTDNSYFDYAPILDEVRKDGLYYAPTNSNTMLDLNQGTGFYKVHVSAKTHKLTINFVNQYGKTVYIKTVFVTNYGKTYIDELPDTDKSYYLVGNKDNNFVNNNNSVVNVKVESGVDTPEGKYAKTNGTRNSMPDIVALPDPYGYNSMGDNMYTNVNIVDSNGQVVKTLFVGDSDVNVIGINDIFNNLNNFTGGNKLTYKMSDFKNLPESIDLTKGPYNFQLKGSSNTQNNVNDASQSPVPVSPQPDNAKQHESSSQPTPINQSHSSDTTVLTEKPAPESTPQFTKPAAKVQPSKAQLKSVEKYFNQSKHAVKSDNAKLKALKKKMKKHANKKQKAAYKSLQTKLSADKKAVKSYKIQEGKLTKYFKNVAIIKSDDKKIKSLTSQMKKLKKSHSKASKKKYAKAAKALKKANSSLKAATKFVNNYK